MIRTPKFWKEKWSVISLLLSPISLIYALITQYRVRRKSVYEASIPVICVGNITVGGSGKTPVCLYLAEKLQEKNPFFLSRGYGARSKFKGLVTADLTAESTGDEVQLLAETAPTVVNHNRSIGAKTAEASGAGLIIMDDGYQNPTLKKDVNIVVFDGSYGIGNGRIFPAGPLRESIETGLKRAQAVIIIGNDENNLQAEIAEKFPQLRILKGTISADEKQLEELKDKRLLAFSGIAHPNKFYRTLRDNGLDVRGTKDFPDHHFYREKDLLQLEQEASIYSASLITTRKDYVRLNSMWQNKIKVLDINLHLSDEERFLNICLKE